MQAYSLSEFLDLRSLANLLDFFRVFLPPALEALEDGCRHAFKVLDCLRPFCVVSFLRRRNLVKGKYRRKHKHMSSPADPIQPPKNAVKPNAVKPKDASSDKRPEPPKSTPSPSKIEPSPERSSERYHCKPDSTPLWKIILEVGAVFVGLVVAGIYYGQLKAMIKSNEISRQALIAVQRAFVGFSGIQSERRLMWSPELIIGSDHKMVNGKSVDLHTPKTIQPEGHYPLWDLFGTFENSGNTPANNVTVQVFADTNGSEPSQEAFAFDPNRSVDTLAPKAGTAANCGRPYFDSQLFLSKVDEQDLTKTFVNPKFLVWGWAVYNDSLSPETRVTEFCQRLHGVRQTPKGLELIFTNCQSHNCADRQCPDYEYVVRALKKAGKINN